MARQARQPPQEGLLNSRGRNRTRTTAKGSRPPKRSRGGSTVAQVLIPWLRANSGAKAKKLWHLHYAGKAIIAEAGSVHPCDLNSLHVIKAFASEERHTQGVRYSRTTAYKRILRYLHEEHGAPLLVRAVPKVQVPAPRAVTATTEERQMLMAAAPPSLRCWLMLCSDLAMRAMTAAAITPEHYDRAAGTITFVTKFGSTQTLPVTEELRQLFDEAEARIGQKAGKGGRNVVGRIGGRSTPYTSLLSRLGRVSYVTLQHSFATLRRKLGITRQLTAHDLRRTTAVRVYQVNRDLRAVQALLGHRTLATTLYYLDHRNTPVNLANLELAKLNPKTEAIN